MENKLQPTIEKIVEAYPPRFRDDIRQECWIVAIEREHQHDPEKGTLFTFFYKILHGVCKRYINRNKMDHKELDPNSLICYQPPIQ